MPCVHHLVQVCISLVSQSLTTRRTQQTQIEAASFTAFLFFCHKLGSNYEAHMPLPLMYFTASSPLSSDLTMNFVHFLVWQQLFAETLDLLLVAGLNTKPQLFLLRNSITIQYSTNHLIHEYISATIFTST